jgi:hypothetical protein
VQLEGRPITYGSSFQLLHLSSNKFLCGIMRNDTSGKLFLSAEPPVNARVLVQVSNPR